MITHGSVPIVLGPFRLLAPLGQGGFGEVWRGVHEDQDVPVAIKLLGGSSTDEVRALAALDHPNLLMIFDHGMVPAGFPVAEGTRRPTTWIATELCSGGSLARAGPRNWNQLRRIAADLLAGLAYAHARGVLHRDLTPDNVLVSSAGDVRPGLKLGDFGLSIPAEFGNGRIAGTPAYMAPEQFTQDYRQHGPWTDLYACGCLLWQLSTGEPPFGSSRPPEVLAAAHAQLDAPAFVPRFAVPRGFEVLLRALLEKAPAARVQCAAETLSALDAVDGQASRGVPRDWRTGSIRRQPMRLIGAGLGLYAWRPVPVIGRDVERDQLWGALCDARDNGGTRIICLTGPAGIGKRALANWLCVYALETGAARVAELRSPGLDAVGALATALASLRPTPPEERVDPAAVRDRVVNPQGADGVGGSGPANRTGHGSAARRFGSLRGMLAGARANGNVVLQVDLGAADPAPVLQRLVALATAGEGLGGLLVVVTCDATPDRPSGVDRIALGPLGPAHQVQLVEGALGLAGEAARYVRERAGGVPGRALEGVGDLLRRGALHATDEGLVLVRGCSLAGAAPELAMAPPRFDPADTLDLDYARALRVAATGDHAQAASLLHALAQAAFTRDYWAVMVVVRARDACLQQAGRAAGDAVWGEGWLWAARAAADVYDWAEAGRLTERLIAAGRLHGWVGLLSPAFALRAEVAGAAGDPATAQQWAREAHALALARGDDHGLARSARLQGRFAFQRGLLAEAAKWFQQAQALYTRLDQPAGAGACLLHRAEVARAAGNPPLAAELIGQARAALQRRPDALGHARVLLLDAAVAPDGVDTLAACTEAMGQAEAEGARAIAAEAAIRAGLGLLHRPDRADEAAVWLTRGLREAAACGDRALVDLANSGLGVAPASKTETARSSRAV